MDENIFKICHLFRILQNILLNNLYRETRIDSV